ncbi:hypothetical protein HII31_05610 [Pseudocercospora fuligena]|uniref:Rhodopsin domain-containing protein n=1 Tax=Pseudocercospora fuligena TaxID=685502 RepID=A0A8H6VM07_9PEZI|nr:hypothetical protein HII31_05610 [Pseudocercospora fuligena]
MRLDTSFDGIVSLVAVFLFLTALTVALRFASRHGQKIGFWIDDYLAIAALIGFIGMSTAVLYGVDRKFIGYKEPKSKAVVNAVHSTMELTYISLDATQIWTFGTVKLCALFFYRRVFCTRVKRGIFDYITWVMIAIVAAWIIGFMVFTFEVCPGHSVSWYVQPGRIASCRPNLDYKYFDANTISDFILDVLVLGMAFPKIWSFHLTTSQKAGISSVFLLALGGVAASCARMVIITHLVRTGRAINDEDGYGKSRPYSQAVKKSLC